MKSSHYIIILTILLISLCFWSCGGNLSLGKGAAGGGAYKVDVDDVLKRVQTVKNNFQAATFCLSLGRDIVFDIAATKETKELLNSKEADLAAAESDEDRERITIEIEELKDDEIDRAHESGELENKKLNEQQLKNSGKLIFNLGLAIILDKYTIQNGPKIITDGQAAINNARQDKFQWVKIAAKANKLTVAVTKDIPDIINEAPHQVETLGALLEATKTLKKNNNIEELEAPKEDDQFMEIDF